MLPGSIVGTLQLEGRTRRFALDTASGAVTLDEGASAGPRQALMSPGERRAAKAQVAAQVPGASAITLD